MYNVYRHIALAACAIAAISLSSCGGSTDNKGSEAQVAFDEAQREYDNGDARQCIALLDSLDSKYAKDMDVMKQSMGLRPKALLQIAVEDIAAADSIINANKERIDSLRPMMTHIDVPGTEGYSVCNSMVDANFMNKTGVSARVSEIGEFYLVSSVNPAGGLKHWSVSAVVGDKIATTDTVACDGALNFRVNNSEVITFTPAGSKEIGELVASNEGLPVKILFNGQNGGSKSITLNAKLINGIATAYRYAKAVNDMRDATINRERLNARADKLQQQIGNNGNSGEENTGK